MLVLTRKRGEKIMIGGDVVVTVLGRRGEHVRIGISAPRGVPVHRKEKIDASPDAEGVAAAEAGEAPQEAARWANQPLDRPPSPAGGRQAGTP